MYQVPIEEVFLRISQNEQRQKAEQEQTEQKPLIAEEQDIETVAEVSTNVYAQIQLNQKSSRSHFTMPRIMAIQGIITAVAALAVLGIKLLRPELFQSLLGLLK